MPELHQPFSSNAFSIPQIIPIFPLPNVVFFPDTYLPLHIFEPRYQEMVSDVSQVGQCIGMVLLKEGWEDDYYENPPVETLGCVGRIKSIQSLDDGRSNIVLHGLQRFDIEEETGERTLPSSQDIITAPCSLSNITDAIGSASAHENRTPVLTE